MLKDAASYAAEDRKRREEVEQRNEADSLVYQVERKLSEVGSALPVHEKARLEEALQSLKNALKEGATPDAIRGLKEELSAAAVALEQAEAQGAGNSGHHANSSNGDHDVIDAEF